MLLTVTTLSTVKYVLPTSSTEISCLAVVPWDSSTAARAVVLAGAGKPRTSSTPTARTKPCGAASDQEQDEDLSEKCFLIE